MLLLVGDQWHLDAVGPEVHPQVGGVLAAGGALHGRPYLGGRRRRGLLLGGAGGMRQSAAVQGMASVPDSPRRQHDPPLSLDHLAHFLRRMTTCAARARFAAAVSKLCDPRLRRQASSRTPTVRVASAASSRASIGVTLPVPGDE